MGDTINWGIFKRHFWGELLRHQQSLSEAFLPDARIIALLQRLLSRH
jgi:hypothetical protein